MQGLWDACRRGRYLCFDKPFVWPFLDKPSERFSLRQAQGPHRYVLKKRLSEVVN